jgi:hypothetical protein
MLAGGVNGGSGSPFVAVGRQDVDDAAAALSLHDAELMLQAKHPAENVGVEGGGVRLRRLLRRRAGLALGAGGVDGDVQMSEPRDVWSTRVLTSSS